MGRIFEEVDKVDLSSIISESEELKENVKYCENCYSAFDSKLLESETLCSKCKLVEAKMSDLDIDVETAMFEIEDLIAIRGEDLSTLSDEEVGVEIEGIINDFYGSSSDEFKDALRARIYTEKNQPTSDDSDFDNIEEGADGAGESMAISGESLSEDVKEDIGSLQSLISELEAGIEGAEKAEIDDVNFGGEVISVAQARSKINDLSSDLDKLQKDKNANLGNAFGDNALNEGKIEYTFEVWIDGLQPVMFTADYDVVSATKEYLENEGEGHNVSEVKVRFFDETQTVDVGLTEDEEEDDTLEKYKEARVITMGPSDLDSAKEGSYYTITGAGGTLAEWTDDYDKMLSEKGIGIPKKWFTFKGKDVNEKYNLQGDNKFKEDLTFLAFPLTDLDVGKLAMFKLQMQDRWFDDIIANSVSDEDEDIEENVVLENRTLTEAIATFTNVDNIDQESKDAETIKKAQELVGGEKVTTITNDQFRDLRLKLANKDYDVVDRLEDYALVRAEDVVYTWLRDQDKNLKEAIKPSELSDDEIGDALDNLAQERDFALVDNIEIKEPIEEAMAGEGLQASDIPVKVDQGQPGKRLELAKIVTEGVTSYRASYLNEDDEELIGFDIDAESDEVAEAELDKYADTDTIDDLLTAQFVETGIEGVSSLNYKNTNIFLSSEEDNNTITITQDGVEPVVFKGATFDEVMNQTIGWVLTNLIDEGCADDCKDEGCEDKEDVEDVEDVVEDTTTIPDTLGQD